jgi:hypothetical protein
MLAASATVPMERLSEDSEVCARSVNVQGH